VRSRYGDAGLDLDTLIVRECAFVPQLLVIAEDVAAHLPGGTPPSCEAVLFEIGVAAEPFYRGVWAACSSDEKLALRQLAEEGVVNPRNATVIAHLLRAGLVDRDPVFRPMNETFRRFVMKEMPDDALSVLEHQGVAMPWASITTTVLTMALGLVGLLILTQQQLIDAWIGYVPALAPAVPTVVKMLGSLQGGSKPQPA
jgi:hypothetical protein